MSDTFKNNADLLKIPQIPSRYGKSIKLMYDKYNSLDYAPSKDLDLHLLCLESLIAVHMKKAKVLSYADSD